MDFKKLLNSFETLNTPKKSYDDNSGEFWKLTQDKAGDGSAIIRFLPSKNIDDIPFVRIFNHAFKNEETGRWYIENSLSTLGEEDPVGQLNSADWNTGLDEKKEEARARKRKLTYISNILVLKDPANPDNEGKVFKFKYGKKIMEKVMAAAKPDLELDPDAEAINAFDPIEGANFSLKITRVANYPNYDQSQFGSKSKLFKGDQAKIDAILEKCFDINEEIAPAKFKSFEDLQKKLNWVLGANAAPAKVAQKVQEDDELEELKSFAEDKPKTERKVVKTPTVTDEEDDIALFQSLLDTD